MDTPTAGHDRGISRRALSAASLGERLRAIGFTPFFTDATGSTNTDLVEAVRAERPGGASGGTGKKTFNFYNQSGQVAHLSVLLAEEQLAGRGRMGRSWTAPKHSQIIASVVLRLYGIHADSMGLLPLLTGMAIAQGVREASEAAGRRLPVELKWPNDVLVEGRKLAGILVEAANVEASAVNGRQASPLLKEAVVVLGFGVNYDLTTEELPVAHATSIALEGERAEQAEQGELAEQGNQASQQDQVATGPNALADPAGDSQTLLPEREDVVFHILDNLARDVERFTQLGGAPEAVIGRYRQLSATIGSRVKAFLPGDEFVTGIAEDLDKSGELIIKVEAHEGTRPIAVGQRLTVAAGDVEHLRATDDDNSRTSEWGYA
ncbi:biotin--[acetyl-CoA-carboxylase] ligase [Corynebacterium auriscanis]|uniref:biotin--[acetyl-CoA-carboxylase] ligase n=1 Tax=Corynebacterium auriscanis TaxID=99807 RepID=UPI0024ACCF06|nr:biotin--[acetyl-CoA-carboxylase] ligase [Corynebacterium auriscanis]